MAKNFFDDWELPYCNHCGKEISDREDIMNKGLCSECARKMQQKKIQHYVRKRNYKEIDCEEN